MESRRLAAITPEDLDAVGYRAFSEGHRDIALTLYARLAASGHPDLAPQAMSNLGYLLEERGEVEEAEGWYRRGADAGDGKAMSNLGYLLEKRGEVEEAERWY